MNTKINAYIILAAVVAALNGLLFGFDKAVISGTTPILLPYFELTDISFGWAFSSLLVGAIIGVVSVLLMLNLSPRRVFSGIQDGCNRKRLISETGDKKKAFFVLQDYYTAKKAEYDKKQK